MLAMPSQCQQVLANIDKLSNNARGLAARLQMGWVPFVFPCVLPLLCVFFVPVDLVFLGVFWCGAGRGAGVG